MIFFIIFFYFKEKSIQNILIRQFATLGWQFATLGWQFATLGWQFAGIHLVLSFSKGTKVHNEQLVQFSTLIN